MTLKYGAGFLCLLFLSFLCISCSHVQAGWDVLMGNASFQRGEFQKSSLEYLSADKALKGDDVVAYNLGNVYNALGETNTALATWSRISQPSSDELAFRLAFNMGYLQYQKGQYDAACNNFRTALILRPQSLDAKRNLELCLLKTQNFETDLPARPKSGERGDLGDSQRALLDYLSRLEGTRWKANNQIEPSVVSSSDW